MKAEYEEFMRITPCRKMWRPATEGGSACSDGRWKNIAEVTEMSIENLQTFFMGSLELTQQQKMIGGQILKRDPGKN